MSFLGFPFMRFIDINGSEKVLRAIPMTLDTLPPEESSLSWPPMKF